MTEMNWNINLTVMENYLKCCLETITDENIFNNFKQDDRYLPILEHVSYDNSVNLIREMGKFQDIITLEKLSKIKENDSLGNASIFNYEYFGGISPSTIRYIKNSVDIIKNNNIEQLKTIVEIGGGYGGLCKVLHDLIDIKSYTIIDLEEPTLLSKKYLNRFEINVNVKTPNDDLDFEKGIDLVISNYAFSEVTRELQEVYIHKVISKCKNFYFIYNNISNTNMTVDEFIAKINEVKPNFQILLYNDYENNTIIYGHNYE